MKNWINKISREKLQRYLFVGVLALVFVAFFISLSLIKPKDIVPPPKDNEGPPINKPIEEEYEIVKSPVEENLIVVRKFFDVNLEQEERLLAYYKIGSRYSTSKGVSWKKEDGETFDVYASLSGTVKSVRSDNLYGMVVVIDHGNDLETHYISLGEVIVTEGTEIKQGDKIGASAENSYDDLGNHVHLKVFKKDKVLDPLSLIGKKVNTIN